MKTCFKCNIPKPLEEFYKHSAMADGRLGKCKECTKSDVRNNYSDKRDQYREYDRTRAMLPHRVEAREKYQAEHPEVVERCKKRWAENNPEKIRESTRKYRESNPEKYAAHVAVGNAVRDGKLTKKPCQSCGAEEVEAHHDDYSKPLEVVWLCKPHHFLADEARREKESVA